MARITLVVVNYNGGQHLEALARDLLADDSGMAEVVFVDNASNDSSRAHLEALPLRPGVRVVLSDVNLGYAGAVNRVLPEVRTDYVGILNMDLMLDPGWLPPLLDFLDAHPDVAGVNPLILSQRDGRISAAGQRLHVTGLGFNRTSKPRGEAPFRVAGLHGAAMVVRTEALEGIGGMDASGFLYHEDVNLSWLLRLMGHDLFCVPRSVVHHDYFLSMYPEKLYLLERNRLAMALAYLQPSSLCMLGPAFALTEVLTWGYALMKGRAFVHAKASSYRWVVAQRHAILARRRWVADHRHISDWQLLRHLRLGYEWGQVSTLARESHDDARVPEGGPTVEIR